MPPQAFPRGGSFGGSPVSGTAFTVLVYSEQLIEKIDDFPDKTEETGLVAEMTAFSLRNAHVRLADIALITQSFMSCTVR